MAFSIADGPSPGQRIDADLSVRSEGMEVIETAVNSIAKAYQFTPR